MNGNEFEYFLDNLSLSTLLAKSSFAFLLVAMLLYWFQASFQSNRETECTSQSDLETLEVQRWGLPSTFGAQANDSEFNTEGAWMPSLFGKAPSLAMGLANITLALMLLIRWFESGHFPLSNLYESLLFLSWSLTSIHFFLERAFSKGGLLLPTLGAITAPLALFTNAFATFSLPQEMQKVSVLVPALQSNWLIMHVSVMMVSYAALLSGSLLAMAFLVVKYFSDSLSVKNVEKLGYKRKEIVQDNQGISPKISYFHPEGYNMSTPSSSPLVLNPPNELGDKKLSSCSEPEASPRLSLSAKLTSVVSSFSFANLPLYTYGVLQPLHRRLSGTFGPQATSSASFMGNIGAEKMHYVTQVNRIRAPKVQEVNVKEASAPGVQRQIGQHQVNGADKMEKHDRQNLLIKNAGLNIPKGEETFEEKLKQTLDNLSYRSIGLGFALLTIGIFSGAVWANEAWGSYWSWDPKETWAFVTWLVFALYLHTRLSRGWVGKESALVATFGFLVIWFCYLGVNLFGKGLHSYGWFPNN